MTYYLSFFEYKDYTYKNTFKDVTSILYNTDEEKVVISFNSGVIKVVNLGNLIDYEYKI